MRRQVKVFLGVAVVVGCLAANLWTAPAQEQPKGDAQVERGAYLVNGPGHCAECHSPRNVLGGIVSSQRFAGGPVADGDDWAPNITPLGLQHSNDGPWSEKDIASFLDDGMTPSGDYAGGRMAEVVRNTTLISADDRAAIANYVVSLPPTEGPPPPKKEK